MQPNNNKKEITFLIVVPMYNVSKWVAKTVQSVQCQTYQNFKCILIDDISTDTTADVVETLIQGDPRFTCVRNTVKKYALENIVYGINRLDPKDDDVIVTLDGDDWFAHEHVLDRVKREYESTGCMMTYGSFQEHPSKEVSTYISEFPDSVKLFNLYRKAHWRSTHLRTFYYRVWKQIEGVDLRDKEGVYFKVTWDLAFMFPMLEICDGQVACISDVLYIYNCETEINDSKINRDAQIAAEIEIRERKPYSPIYQADKRRGIVYKCVQYLIRKTSGNVEDNSWTKTIVCMTSLYKWLGRIA